MTNPEIYRARSSYFFAVSIYFFCAGITAQSFFVETVGSFITTLSWCLLICYLFHLGFIRAKVIIFDEGITITNPLRETTVGWDQVQEINVKYSMYISVDGEKINAWAAQAPGRYHSRTVHATEIRGLQIPDTNSMRAGESPRSHSGVAVALARIRFDAFAKSQTVGTTYVSEFNRNGLVTLVVLFTAAILLTFS
jgi:hypothetical protein